MEYVKNLKDGSGNKEDSEEENDSSGILALSKLVLDMQGAHKSCSGSSSELRFYPIRNYKNLIIITVDATPSRAGGLLILPQQRLIYYYSIYWSHVFDFRKSSSESDKFEMINAFLAMEIFEDYISLYRHFFPNDRLVIKTDNDFFTNFDAPTVPNRKKKKKEIFKMTNEKLKKKRIFEMANEKLKTEPFEGCWTHAAKSYDDEMKMADKLSRKNYTSTDELPNIRTYSSEPFWQGYGAVNVSWLHCSKLHFLKTKINHLL